MADIVILWDYIQAEIISSETNYTVTPTEYNEECYQIFSEEDFRTLVLLPAVVCILILAFTQKRKYRWQGCLKGRPGLVHPMDVLSRSHRFSYAAAFGILSNLCYNVILEQKYAFQYTGPLYLKVFVALLSMLIYGVSYFPLFGALSVQNSVGYFIGTLFAWAYATVYVLNKLICNLSAINYITLIVNELPLMICHLYLVVSLPLRFILSFKRKQKLNMKFAVDFENDEDLYEAIRNSYQGIHVRKLYAKPPPPPSPPTGIVQKVLSVVKNLLENMVYQREANFRYSTRMISVMTVSFLVIYYLTVGLLRIAIWVTDEIMRKIDTGIRFVDYISFLNGVEQEAKSILEMIKSGVFDVKVVLCVTIPVTFLIGLVMILNSLSNYRFVLKKLYQGNHLHLTPREGMSFSSSLVGSMRYAGYQVGYIVWGYMIQLLVLSLVAGIVTALIELWQYVDSWILDKLMAVWPVLLTSLVVNFSQLLLAKFVFLQERGNTLAIDNRRLLFITTYFLFFYNIFIGFVSCLLRILKSIGLGALFLPRLDHSTLPPKFQNMDPGFYAYCGFMHVENAHTHPVVMVFISILQAESFHTLKANHDKSSLKHMIGDSMMNGVALSKGRGRAKWKWLLAYTLVNNPTICVERKMTLAKQKNESIVLSILQDGYTVEPSPISETKL